MPLSDTYIRTVLENLISRQAVPTGRKAVIEMKEFLHLMLDDNGDNAAVVTAKLSEQLPLAMKNYYGLLFGVLSAGRSSAENPAVLLGIQQKTQEFMSVWKPTVDALLDEIVSEKRAHHLLVSRRNTLSPSGGGDYGA